MDYPILLSPSGIESIVLLGGRSVAVPKTAPAFRPWTGTPVKDTKGGKPILEYHDQPFFAELLIVRVFEESGWKAVWVDNFPKRHFRTSYWPPNDVALPLEQKSILENIDQTAGGKGGSWDVLAWKEKQFLFAEVKWISSTDRIRSNQGRWLSAAIACGLQPESFLLVEWSLQSIR